MGRSRGSSTFQARRPSKPLSRVVVDGGGKRQKGPPAEVAVKSKTAIRGGGGGGGSAGGQSNRKRGCQKTTSSDADDDAEPEGDEELSESGEEEEEEEEDVGSEDDESQEEEDEEEERLPYGLMRHDLDEMPDDMAAMMYERDQVLWVRLSAKDRAKCKSPSALLTKLHKANPALFTTQWSVENAGSNKKEALSADAILTPAGPGSEMGAFYVSSVLQKDDSGVKKFLDGMPFACPKLLSRVSEHDDGVWLFLGGNPPPDAPSKKGGKKRSSPGATGGGGGGGCDLQGRPEHTDAVDHSGTWHVQLSGLKTWHIRPVESAPEFEGCPPDCGDDELEGVKEGGGGYVVECEAGDLLLINTRAWWHRTTLPVQDGNSVSYARDFYLGGRKAAAIDGDGGGKTNDECLDPRLYASRAFSKGQVVLDAKSMPDEDIIPVSRDPSCKLDPRRGLIALRNMAEGDIVCVEGDEEGEFEEYELDTETGEMVRV